MPGRSTGKSCRVRSHKVALVISRARAWLTRLDVPTPIVGVGVLRSIDEVDVARWDMIQPPGGFYASSPWLIHAERTAATPPYYLFTRDWGAAMPAYMLEETSP